MNKKFLIAVALAFFSVNSQAEFITMDWKDSGDSLITIDTDTQLQWLDFEPSRNMSFWEVSYELVGVGLPGLFPGFRYASGEEVEKLIVNFGFVPQFDGVYRAENFAPAQSFFSYFGSMIDNGASYYVMGRASEESNSEQGYSIGMCYAAPLSNCPADGQVEFPAHLGTAYAFSGKLGLDAKGYELSNWLVRDVPLPVPEPISASLFIAAFITLILSRRRKKLLI